MTEQIIQRELEALSAYLDGQLSSKERTNLERLLEERADLRTALDGLSHTRAILRSQPPLRAPRNFILTPEQAGIRTKQPAVTPLFSAMRLASVLASVLFILVAAGDLLTGGRNPASYTQAYRSLPVEAPREVQEAESQFFAETQADTLSSEPVEAPAAAEEFVQKSVQVTQAVSEDAAILEAPAAPSAYPPPAEVFPESPGLLGTTGLDSPTGEPTQLPTALPTILAQKMEGEQSAPEVTNLASDLRSTWYLWRLMEVILIFLALSSGLFAYLLSRSRSV